MVEGIAKLPILQGLRCFYLEPSSAGVAGAMIKAFHLIDLGLYAIFERKFPKCCIAL